MERFTVPLLWDKKTEAIVNNESAEIIRMFNTAFNDQLPADKAKLDLYPKDLQKEIDATNEWVYDTINSEWFAYRTRESFINFAVLAGRGQMESIRWVNVANLRAITFVGALTLWASCLVRVCYDSVGLRGKRRTSVRVARPRRGYAQG